MLRVLSCFSLALMMLGTGTASANQIDCHSVCDQPGDRVFEGVGAVDVVANGVCGSSGSTIFAGDLDQNQCPMDFFCGINVNTLRFTDPALVNLNLVGLECVGGKIYVDQSAATLVGIRAPHLTAAGTGLEFNAVPKLIRISFSALQILGTAEGDPVSNLLWIKNNPSLGMLPMYHGLYFPNLTTVHGDLIIEGNAALRSLASFDWLNTVFGNLFLMDNASLDICGPQLDLQGLTTVGKDFAISSLPKLSCVDLPGLVAVGSSDPGAGILTILANDSLVALDLSGLMQAHSLAIDENPVLPALGRLIRGLTELPGTLSLQDNAALWNISALGSLTTIGHSLFIQRNDVLGTNHGLSGLTSVGEVIDIMANPMMGRLDFHRLVSAGKIWIRNNQALVDMAFTSLASVDGSVFLTNNDALLDIGGPTTVGFPSLSIIGAGLPPSAPVGGVLAIEMNDGLDTVTFPSLTHITSQLMLTNNPIITGIFLPNACDQAAWPDPPAVTSHGGTEGQWDDGCPSLVAINEDQLCFDKWCTPGCNCPLP